MDILIDLLKLLKTYFVPLIFRWVMKIGGTWLLATTNWSEDQLLNIISGIVMLLIGFITSLINKKSDLAKEPTQ